MVNSAAALQLAAECAGFLAGSLIKDAMTENDMTENWGLYFLIIFSRPLNCCSLSQVF